jgi:hypothetical protein
MSISRLFKRLRRWSSQAFRKRHSPAAFRTCRNAGNSVLAAEGPTSKGTGSISCEVEFRIFYRLGLRTLRTKDVFSKEMRLTPNKLTYCSWMSRNKKPRNEGRPFILPMRVSSPCYCCRLQSDSWSSFSWSLLAHIHSLWELTQATRAAFNHSTAVITTWWL